jgi:hypothetical protein
VTTALFGPLIGPDLIRRIQTAETCKAELVAVLRRAEAWIADPEAECRSCLLRDVRAVLEVCHADS